MLRIHARRFESVRVNKRADGFDAGRRRRERGRGFVLVLEERVRRGGDRRRGKMDASRGGD